MPSRVISISVSCPRGTTATEEGPMETETRVRRQDGGSGRRFLLYSHDGAGLGHTRRNLAIAAAVTRRDPSAAVLLATGSESVSRLGLPDRVDFLKLPEVRKEGNGRYTARHLSIGSDALFHLRAALLQAAVQSFQPNVMLVDKHPLGAKRELLPAIGEAKQAGTRLILGLRDILDDPDTTRREWYDAGVPEVIERDYDQILVYGSPAVLDPVREYGLPATLAARTAFCGYVIHREGTCLRASDAPPTCMVKPRSRPIILATVGGGEDGFPLLETFISASQRANWQGVIVTGPLASADDRIKLSSMAERAGIPVYTVVGCLAAWFPLVDAVVCMGGYNTLVEVASTGTPAVCVPRVEPRREQAIRADAFARLGLLRVLVPRDLTATSLSVEIDIALTQSRDHLRSAAQRELDFGGAESAAEQLLAHGAPRPATNLGRLAVSSDRPLTTRR